MCRNSTNKEIEALELINQDFKENHKNGNVDKLINIDSLFHQYLSKICHNDILFEVVHNLPLTNLFNIAAKRTVFSDYAEFIWNEHSRIILAIKMKDKQKAKRELEKHLRDGKDRILSDCNYLD